MKRSLLACALAFLSFPAEAGGLAILETVLTDNGDNDGFADTNETVSVRLRVQNTSGVPLQGVSVTLRGGRPGRACLTTGTIQVGDLAPAEVRLTTGALVLHVAANIDRTWLGLGTFADLSVTYEVHAASQAGSLPAHPPKLSFDLDLDGSGGSGATTFFESFENGMGAFEVQNLDQNLTSAADSNGYRCQYNDPNWPNSNLFDPQGQHSCHMGAYPGQSGAVWWGLSGPEFSPAGGRGFSGFHSLFFGVDMGPPENWTTPLAILEAVRTAQPIRLGLGGPSPVLSMKHQASLTDSRLLPEILDPGDTVDRGVVMAQVADDQGNPAGPWFKIHAFQNDYDQIHTSAFFDCSFDPTDDGSTEDDFYDPSDPDRRYGPSSTCFPEPIFAFIGETSEAYSSANVGLADGPALQGLWGIGTWIESKFDLGRFRGRQVRLRFLATALNLPFASTWEGYGTDDGSPFNPLPGDDGWWIDDVTVTGALTTAAVVAVDTHDNSGLPNTLPDVDGDGINDSCDNCAAQANTQQYDRDFDGIGNVCDVCINDPTNLDDDSDTVCNIDDNCPQNPNQNQLDGDGDTFGAACDCNDANAATHPGATVEINDGQDNQCPGDAGYGAVDEITGSLRFRNAANENELSWPPQSGATKFQVARGSSRTFTVGCTSFVVNPSHQEFDKLNDPQQPAAGGVFYYLVRPIAPYVGSWGLRSDGSPITVPCS